MSEAVNVLMTRAKTIESKALDTYKKRLQDALLVRDTDLADVTNLRKAAQLVCEHPNETFISRTQACGTHGRELEYVKVYTCEDCGKYLRTEDE